MRKRPSHYWYLVSLALVYQVVLAKDVHAYVDPGTGSYLFQMLLAVFLGATFTLKHYWRSLKARISGRKSPQSSDDAETP